MEAGEYDATVLAAAGLRRLGVAFEEREALPIADCPPAPGQGALAVQMRADDPRRARVRELLDDRATHACVDAERDVLRLAGATCALALGVYARIDGARIVIDAALVVDGVIRRAHGRGSAPRELAREVAGSLGVLAHA